MEAERVSLAEQGASTATPVTKFAIHGFQPAPGTFKAVSKEPGWRVRERSGGKTSYQRGRAVLCRARADF